MDEQIVRVGRDAFRKAMRLYLELVEMPLYLTGQQLNPAEELGRLQEIHRLLLEHRARVGLAGQLYSCPGCGHYEGEHHAGDCSSRTFVPVARPPGWQPALSEPVEIIDFSLQPCPFPGCLYMQLPGVGFCAQHRAEPV